FHVSAANVDCIQFIGSDSAVQELLAAGVRIEAPFTPLLNHWDRKWPVLLTNEEECSNPGLGIQGNAVLLPSFSSEIGCVFSILRELATENDTLHLGAKYLGQCGLIEFVSGLGEGSSRLLWRIKRPHGRWNCMAKMVERASLCR